MQETRFGEANLCVAVALAPVRYSTGDAHERLNTTMNRTHNITRTAALAFGVAALTTAPGIANAQTVTTAFAFTDADQSYTVPTGVTSITVKLWGAGGGTFGGSGAFVTGSLAVTPGTTLTLIVGAGGSSFPFNSYGGGGSGNFGSGGGRSGIRFGGVELVTAGAGGGQGGGGGGLTAGQRGRFGSGEIGGAGGGTQTAGGAGFGGGANGTAFQGGDGTVGGGGGGYFGGGGASGGGIGSNQSSSGGGGSSFTSSAAFTFSSSSADGQTGTSAVGVAPGGASDIDYAIDFAGGVGRGDGSTPVGVETSGGNGRIVIIAPVIIPEASSLALLLPALVLVGSVARRRK